MASPKARIGRGGVTVGAAGAGVVHDGLNGDERTAVGIVVQWSAGAQDPEDRDGNLEELARPRR